MKWGIDTYSYHYAAGLWEYSPTSKPFAQAAAWLTKAHELGLDGVQYCDTGHLESLEPLYLHGLRSIAESLGLYIELGTVGTNPTHLKEMLQAAKAVGSPVLRTFVGERPPKGLSLDEHFAAVTDRLLQVMPVCDELGISLAIENHQEFSVAELLILIDMVGSSSLGICLDTGNCLATLEDPLAAARFSGSHTKTLHFKDYQVAAAQGGFALIGCPLGEGVIQLREILTVMATDAPEATLNIETYIGNHFIPLPATAELATLPEQRQAEIDAIAQMVQERGVAEVPVLPLERGCTEDELLAIEDAAFRRSVAWTKTVS
jgi:3-oxoisoapionate decarboxylase